jgi:hypothetical protein
MPAVSRTLLVRNLSSTSTLVLNVGSLAAPFTVAGGGQYSLAPRASASVTITFNPDILGSASQELPIISSDPKHPLVNVAVSGVVQAGRLVVPKTIAITAHTGLPAIKTIVLRNSGKGMLSGTVQQFDPAAAFTLQNGPIPFSIAPGKSQTISVQFAPAASGTTSASLMIETAPPPATTNISVRGSAR